MCAYFISGSMNKRMKKLTGQADTKQTSAGAGCAVALPCSAVNC